MRSSIYISLSALAALVAAQNPFNNPPGGYEFKAGSPTTIKWDPSTQGTVSLKLKWGDANDLETGQTIASDLTNSGSFTWTPSSSLPDRDDYTIEILSDANPGDVNYLPRFSVDGATGPETATPSATSAASTSTDSATSLTTTSATTPTTLSTATTNTTASASSSSAASSTAATSASPTSTNAATTTGASSSSAPTQTSTSVPNSNAAMANRVSVGMVALALAAITFL